MANYEVRRKHIEPLWDRVDANRIRLALFLGMFFVAATLALGLFAAFVVLLAWVLILGGLLDLGIWVGGELARAVFVGTLTVAACIVFVYMARALTRNERWFARRLKAELVPRGDLLVTKYALKDMAIASGFDVAPALYLIDTPNVNAFVYQRGHRRAILGVTRGLSERLDAEEQRAVFANMMARLQQGDMLWASAVTALMRPLWHLRDLTLTANEEIVFDRSDTHGSARPTSAHLDASEVQALGMVVLTVFVVIAEFVAYGHRSSQLRHAEVADAEGMLLLKDPRSMLSALEKSVRFNNFVPTAGPGMTQLFYAWTGEGSTDDEQDPEMRRVTRLREVLGVEGMELPEVKPNEPVLLVAPAAPRFEK